MKFQIYKEAIVAKAQGNGSTPVASLIARGEVAKVVNTKKEAQAAVACVFSTITEALKKLYRYTDWFRNL